MVPDRFKNKTAVVTGGASGIGTAMCRRLLEEGARVVAADVNLARLQEMEAEFKAGRECRGRNRDGPTWSGRSQQVARASGLETSCKNGGDPGDSGRLSLKDN